jgi:hypothetical protein
MTRQVTVGFAIKLVPLGNDCSRLSIQAYATLLESPIPHLFDPRTGQAGSLCTPERTKPRKAHTATATLLARGWRNPRDGRKTTAGMTGARDERETDRNEDAAHQSGPPFRAGASLAFATVRGMAPAAAEDGFRRGDMSETRRRIILASAAAYIKMYGYSLARRDS